MRCWNLVASHRALRRVQHHPIPRAPVPEDLPNDMHLGVTAGHTHLSQVRKIQTFLAQDITGEDHAWW
jgi:hypothetical protein